MSFRPDEPVTAPEQPGRRSLFAAGAGGAAWLGGSQIVGQTLHVAIRLVLARLLAPEAFGLLAAAVAFTSAAQLLLDLGFGAAIIQRRELDGEYAGTAFWAIVTAAGVVGIGLAAVAPVAGWFYRNPAIVPVLRVLCLGILLGAPASYYEAVLSRGLRFRVIGLRQIAGTVVAGTLALTAAVNGWGVWALVVYALVRSLVGTGLLAVAEGSLPPLRFSRGAFAELWEFSRPLLGARLLNYVNRNTDNLLIGRYLGASPLGLYALAYQAVLLPLQYVARPIGSVAFPLFSSIQEDRARVGESWRRGTELVVAATWAISGLVVLAAPSGVPLLLGARWIPSVPVIQILAVAAMAQSSTALSPSVLQAIGRTDIVLWWTALNAALNVTAFVTGLRWGIVGVAAAYCAANLVLAVVNYLMVNLVLGQRPLTGAVAWLRGGALLLVMAGVWYSSTGLVAGEGVLQLVVSAGVTSLASVVAMLLLVPEAQRAVRRIATVWAT